jgi:type I restriction enzyme S subunit
MPRRCIYLSEWGTGEELESNKFMFRKNEILFGKLRPYFHKVGVAPVNGVCSTDIVVIAPQSAYWLSFVLGHTSSDAFVVYTDSDSTGTKMPRTSWNRMAHYEIALPPESIAKVFDELVVPTVHQMVANVHESRTLADLRDTLLPKLISGDIRVPEAEHLIEHIEG